MTEKSPIARLRGRKLGSYTLVERIGRGGMGEVWRARHQILSRPAAIKLVKTIDEGGASASALARFEREAELTTRLSHPNTITIFDYGRTAQGQFYYVMELLDGASLQTIVDVVGPQPPSRVGHILIQILGALREAHGTGLIHRDIKPANMFLCTQGGIHDVAKLLDFGLVKDVETDVDLKLTSSGTITGTPHYLAPEAVKTPELADARSDIYSLGAVAYFLLTGEHVFEASSLVELCLHHLQTPPTPPSERLGEELPPALERLVLDCLEKNPDDRPQSADEIISRLTECQLEPWSFQDIGEWWDEYGSLVKQPESDARSVVGQPRERTDWGLYLMLGFVFVAAAATTAWLTGGRATSAAEDSRTAAASPEAPSDAGPALSEAPTPEQKPSPEVAAPGPSVEVTTAADAGPDSSLPAPQVEELAASPPPPEPSKERKKKMKKRKKPPKTAPDEPEELWILD
jgi:serine/threonine protein kinase